MATYAAIDVSSLPAPRLFRGGFASAQWHTRAPAAAARTFGAARAEQVRPLVGLLHPPGRRGNRAG